MANVCGYLGMAHAISKNGPFAAIIGAETIIEFIISNFELNEINLS